MTEPSIPAGPPRFFLSMARGFVGRCPACGLGRIFRRYLKIHPACSACALDLDRYPSDDGPANLTLLLIGQLVITPLLLFKFVRETPAVIIVPATLIPLAILTLVLLPRVKGLVIGIHHALDVSRADAHLHTADRYD